MKVVILTSDYHRGANVAVQTLIRHSALKKQGIEVVGILSASTFALTQKSLRRTWKFLTRSGIKFFLKSVLMNFWQTWSIRLARLILPAGDRKYFDFDELARDRDIPFLPVQDVNSSEALEFVRKLQPDYLVSCILMQIAKKPLLDLPREGAINFHPALTHVHRGSFSSFWTLLKRWRQGGATVHFMTEKVDDGEVIIQRRFFIRPSDTLHCINERSARLGGQLLARALVKLQKREVRIKLVRRLSRLFTMPTAEEVQRFRGLGKRIIRWQHFFEV